MQVGVCLAIFRLLQIGGFPVSPRLKVSKGRDIWYRNVYCEQRHGRKEKLFPETCFRSQKCNSGNRQVRCMMSEKRKRRMRARMQNGEEVGSRVNEVPSMDHERKRENRRDKGKGS